jgi:hypothetical protein
MIALIQLCNHHHGEEGKNQKTKTVNMKKGRKRGEGVWLGASSLTLENPEGRKVINSDHTNP